MDALAASIRFHTDQALIEACLEYNDDAWRELVSRYSRLVLGIPRFYGIADEDAHDIFQDVFAILVQRVHSLRDRQSLAKWLITTTHRVSRRHWDRLRRTVSLDGVALAVEAPPAEMVMRWERQHLVREALRRLGGRCEQLLTALYLDPSGPGYDEIARRLDMPRGSIGPSRARCLAKLLAVLRAGAAPGIP